MNDSSKLKRLLPLPRLMELCGDGDRAKVRARCLLSENHKNGDVHPSAGIYQNEKGDWRFKCQACGVNFGEPDYLKHKFNLSSDREAFDKWRELAGANGRNGNASPSAASMPERRERPALPMMRKGKTEDFERLAELRNLHPEGVHLVSKRGLLWFSRLRGCDAWLVTDSERVNAQARRLDGQPWAHVGAKAWTLRGSWANWPVGIREAQPFQIVALAEGGPDLLAACHFVFCEQREADVAPVGIMGAGQRIHGDALTLFSGKRVRIFTHTDKDGRAAARRWAAQLESVSAIVDAFDFTGLRRAYGSPVGDLNDLTSIHADDFEREQAVSKLLP